MEDSEPPRRSSCGCSEACGKLKVNLLDAVKMPSKTKLKTARRMEAFKESEKHAMETLQEEKTKPIKEGSWATPSLLVILTLAVDLAGSNYWI